MCTGSVRSGGDQLGEGADDDADEALHVCGAAPVEPAVTDLGGERLAVPVLSVDGHDVGVPGQDHPAVGAAVCGRDRGEQVGLGPVLVGQDLRREAVPSHLGGDEVDQLEVGVAARGVEGDEPGDPVQGADLRS